MDTSQGGLSPDIQSQLVQPPSDPPNSLLSGSESVAIPQLHALVIGIDNYQDKGVENLQKACEDARKMKEFLGNTFQKDESKIKLLCNSEATRHSIIKSISDLSSCTEVQNNDPIVIFFAGHGSRIKAPANWPSKDNQIEMLLPYDFTMDLTSQEAIPGIPDITLSVLLHKLSIAKGNNITVILDCCHSGSATRGPGRAREVPLPDTYEISSVIDQDIRENADTKSFAAGFAPHLGSHVLLAACQPTETAREIAGGGVFTSALLALLKDKDTSKWSYESVIRMLGSIGEKQNPQCEGIHKDRILFRGVVMTKSRRSFRVSCENGACTLNAGEAHQITDGDEFELHVNDNPESHRLGRFTARTVTANSASLDPVGATTLHMPQQAHAYQVSAKQPYNLPVYLNEGDEELVRVLTGVADEINAARKFGGPGVEFVKENSAELILTNSDQGVRFDIKDPFCNRNGLHTIPHTVPCDTGHLCRVMSSAANFYWHLRHVPKDTRIISRNVKLECYKLGPPTETDTHKLLLLPQCLGNDLVRNKKAASKEPKGVVQVTASVGRAPQGDEQLYGFRVKSDMECELYTALFCFNMSDLSIDPYYTPNAAASGGEVSCISAHGSLTIGYGDGGHSARTYELPTGSDVDVGHLKLFLSSFSMDVSRIAQDSPFEQAQPESADRGSRPIAPELVRSWDEITVGLVQRSTFEPEASVVWQTLQAVRDKFSGWLQ